MSMKGVMQPKLGVVEGLQIFFFLVVKVDHVLNLWESVQLKSA